MCPALLFLPYHFSKLRLVIFTSGSTNSITLDPSILIYAEESNLEKHDKLVFVYNFWVGDSDAVIELSLYPIAITFVFELLSS